MTRITNIQKLEIKARVGQDADSKELKFARLSQRYYSFPCGALVVIEKKKKRFHIFHGGEYMSGPVNKEMKT